MPPIVYKSLKKPKNVLPGLSDKIYIAPLDWFETIAEVIEPDSADLDRATVISGSHTFKEGKGFIEFLGAPFTTDFTAKSVGETGSKNMEKNPSFFIPGNYAELNATMDMLLNTPVIILLKDADCSLKIVNQIGCDCNPAWIQEITYSSGQQTSGRKGWQLTYSSICPKNMHYKGNIITLPALGETSAEEEDE